jgi:hypothetical protein
MKKFLRFFGSRPTLALVLLIWGFMTTLPVSPGQDPAAPDGASPAYRVLAFNDLGMHCYDSDFSIFSILPLFNVVRAQVVRIGSVPLLLNSRQAAVYYQAIADPKGSINTTSRGKTNFWTYAQALFGLSAPLPVDTGLLGARMPGTKNALRLMAKYDAALLGFAAAGIPITGRDDAQKSNPYSLMNILAKNTSGTELARLPTVVPASEEMNCLSCHATGDWAAKRPGILWSADANLDHQTRKNILLLHDAVNGTALMKKQPVLCAACHYSRPLDLKGRGPQNSLPYLSRAMHGYHSAKMSQTHSGSQTCYLCHPGKSTQCLRGAMANAGLGCMDCHGNMIAVAKTSREPWLQEPKCQSCHTGDAMSHLGGNLILRTAYDGTNPSNAVPRLAVNKRFAESSDTALYRFSLGHHDMACSSCHGSPHAEWPSRQSNDNLAAIKLQGYKGPIYDCRTCHGSGLGRTTDGPHGLHNVAAAVWFNDGHEGSYERDPGACKACHGADLAGTLLSKTPVPRRFAIEGKTISVPAGTPIRCTLCHEKPGTGNRP